MRGDKGAYTEKRKRQAERIEDGYIGLGILAVALGLGAAVCIFASTPIAAAADPMSAPASPPEPKKEESVHPPVKPVPAESRTPEEAAARAADRKDPSGALIIGPPLTPGATKPGAKP